MESSAFGVYSDFQYVSRKNRGKKKRRSKANIKGSDQNSDNSDAVESIDNGETNSNAVESIDNGETNSNAVNENDQNTNDNEDELYRVSIEDRVTTDAQLKTRPTIIEPEEKENLEELKVNLEESTYKEHLYEPPEAETIEIKEFFNSRGLSKYAETYELENFEKKMLVIFNQVKVEGHIPRYGTEKDVEALKNTFSRFGFDVTEHTDLTKKEIFDELDTLFKRDFTDYGCIGIAVLTHGSNSGLLRAKDHQYSEIEIINYFKVHDKPSLVTKPKFLLIQACRGNQIKPGAAVMFSGKIRTDMDSSKEPYILPVEADLLILHSSYLGSVSHRDELCGSWFIQSLCSKINQLAATQDLETIITAVKREVAIDKEHEVYNKKNLEMEVNKQMPVLTTTLIRKLFLRKFGETPLTPLVTVTDSSVQPRRGSHEVLDSVPPSTPMLLQFGPCSCFLEHFDYMKNCLKYFVEDFPEDETAESYLEVAETLEDGDKFNAAKEKLAKAMCKHLTSNAKHCHYYKFLYFYKHV